MASCKYHYKRKYEEYRCTREALPNSPKGYCVLHEDWKHKDQEETKKAFYKEIEEGKRDFRGCILPEIELTGRIIEGTTIFDYAIIEGDADFEGAIIEGDVAFINTTIKGTVKFTASKIEGAALFMGTAITGYARFDHAIIKTAWFMGATILRQVRFDGATIEGDVVFDYAKIKGLARFERATIEGDVFFDGATIGEDAFFDDATIKGEAGFSHSRIGSLTFRNTKFKNMSAQEEACRAAKRTQEEMGNRELADYHFYREMEAKRKQKQWHKKYLELPVQYLFGYGVKPERVILAWFVTVFILALMYWTGDGIEATYPSPEYVYLSILTASPLETTYLSLLTPANLLDCVYYSIATAATPGYGGYYPKPAIFGQLPIYQILAIAEAIFGTFMWAAFIATVARKYMRA